MGGRKMKSKSKGEETRKKKQKTEDVVQSSSSSSSSSSSGVEPTEKIESRDKAFSIDLIWRKLGQCLNYNDLKALRLVSTQFNDAVLYQTRFMNLSVVNLVVDGRLSLKNFGSTKILWKHFKIQFSRVDDEDESSSTSSKKKKNSLDWFYPMLESAQSIEVLALTADKLLNSPPLNLVLAAPAPQTLKKLILHTNVLGNVATVESLKNLSTLEEANLKSLQEFHVTSVLNEGSDRFHEEANYLDVSWQFRYAVDLLIPHLNSLMVIRVENTYEFPKFVKVRYLKDVKRNRSHRRVFNLIKQNEKSLVELHVSDIEFWLNLKNQYPFDMVFPRLKSLSMKASLHGTQDKNIINFLDKQPELEELNMTILHQFPIKVLEKIEQKSKKLKKLFIKTKGFDGEKIGKWNFLKDLNALEDFGMEFIPSRRRFRQREESVKALLSCLPRSIKKLYLKGFPSGLGMVHRYTLYGTNFERLDGNKLTHLTLKSMSDGLAVGDEAMKFICKNFTMLQHLNISGNGDRVTDYGFTAGKMKLRNTTFSLENLKGLRSLFLDSQNVTNMTYLHAIKFQELEHLQISVKRLDSKTVASVTFPAILKSNPSLRTFFMLGKLITIPKMDEMRKWNERIDTVEAIDEYDDKDEDESEHEDDFSDDSDDSQDGGLNNYEDIDDEDFDSES